VAFFCGKGKQYFCNYKNIATIFLSNCFLGNGKKVVTLQNTGIKIDRLRGNIYWSKIRIETHL
jgi:hypothetical protein